MAYPLHEKPLTHERSYPSSSGSTPLEDPIPKPRGEANRLYNLQSATRLREDRFLEICASVQALIATHLDLALCFTKQESAAVDIVCNEATKQYPCLGNFKYDWVMHDLIKLELKRTNQIVQ
ncbi:hypothetical protein BD779DRAFT_1673017 [Infundibulicybe gibba]|nr:hypothetical protein BD779DRAFT_1673017 [Infundibulicybe gibba]